MRADRKRHVERTFLDLNGMVAGCKVTGLRDADAIIANLVSLMLLDPSTGEVPGAAC
jgi:hypothetical protein